MVRCVPFKKSFQRCVEKIISMGYEAFADSKRAKHYRIPSRVGLKTGLMMLTITGLGHSPGDNCLHIDLFSRPIAERRSYLTDSQL